LEKCLVLYSLSKSIPLTASPVIKPWFEFMVILSKTPSPLKAIFNREKEKLPVVLTLRKG
jgi:hypothetical protein